MICRDPSSVTDFTRAAAHQGKNSGYAATSATKSYIRWAEYGKIFVSLCVGIVFLADSERKMS
jgi:hypothetical protein